MAVIERHPDVKDFILEMSLPEIRERGGVADLVEQGNIVLIKDFRLDFDFEVLTRLEKSIDAIQAVPIRRKLKKLEATHFFEGEPPAKVGFRSLRFKSAVRQAMFDVICKGDRKLFAQASTALKASHETVLGIFDTAFPEYDPFQLIASLRLTRTLFENLHWDNHSIDDDFHQARVFANLDIRPRIWHLGHRFPDMMRLLYEKHNLARFAGQDPNEMIDFITRDLLGGTDRMWLDQLPRHRIAFEPGEVWLGESRLVAHQIYYGEAALVYMWFVKVNSMSDPGNRFNAQVEEVHREMQTALT
ncbi:hypothetical protein LZ496_00685 [Sphingomonas sp. NSE70-1]|uniref:Uncharacterized protein n=1 Tax=Sphingomonas caseinilyticus TaxID=2908205 RepID=A0ABT0RQL4_9SPHN|nr:hypothetical protein [Sphingomonas caseinilyticus]MCL6697307.1 hypothetical protein [Sphingomonas caseinilyticus]